MKKYILMFSLLLGCDSSFSEDALKFSCLNIPHRYVAMVSENANKGVFDDSEEALIGISRDEIINNIIAYRKIGKSDFDTLLIYPEPHDMKLKSSDILSSRDQDNTYLKADIYTSYRRLYENRVPKSWLLVNGEDNSLIWVASCNLSGIKDDISGCTFETNISGFGVSYSLNNENITLHKEYEKFIEKKITEWSKCDIQNNS